MRAHLGCLLALVLASACGDKASKADCDKLLDTIIDLELADLGTDELSGEMKADLEAQRKELSEHVRADFVTKCTNETPQKQVACGLRAKSFDDLAACEKTR